MNLQSFYFFALIIFCVFTIKIESRENKVKVYICERNLHISNQGLYFYDINEGYFPINAVFFDNDGLYIMESVEARIGNKPEHIDNKCPNKHERWCTRCGGCAVPWCRIGRCKCVEWPFICLQ